MFLKNRNIISKIKRSKVTDYAALSFISLNEDQDQYKIVWLLFDASYTAPNTGKALFVLIYYKYCLGLASSKLNY